MSNYKKRKLKPFFSVEMLFIYAVSITAMAQFLQ